MLLRSTSVFQDGGKLRQNSMRLLRHLVKDATLVHAGKTLIGATRTLEQKVIASLCGAFMRHSLTGV